MGQWVSQRVTSNIWPFIFYLSREKYWFHCDTKASLKSKYNPESNHDP